jgi:hypothetical protein
MFLFLFWPVCYDSLFSEYPGLPAMKKMGTQTQRAAAMEARKLTGSIEIVLESTQPKKTRHLLKISPTTPMLKHGHILALLFEEDSLEFRRIPTPTRASL